MLLSPESARVLAAVREVLAKWGDRWYLFGAQAVILWGRPRLTDDVDITVKLAPEQVAGFSADMEKAGFRLRVSDAESFLARTRIIPFLHQPTQMTLDVVLAGPGLEDQFLDRVVQVELQGTPMPVVSPEDLIVTKILAGRPKDIDDARSVMEERLDSLDIELIRSTLSLLEQALAQADLLPVFDAEHARAIERRPRKK